MTDDGVLLMNLGCGMLGAGFRMLRLAARLWVLGLGFCASDAAVWMLDVGVLAGSWVLASGCWVLGAGVRLLDSVCWNPASVFWILASGFRFLASGFWCRVALILGAEAHRGTPRHTVAHRTRGGSGARALAVR